MGYYSRFRLIILFFILSTPASGQFPSYVFHNLSKIDDLSENTVRCIIEGKRGFMWFGTEDGYNRYDGYKFIVYKNNQEDQYSVSSSIARCFYNDRKGNLWIGNRHGLNLYDHIQDKFYNYNSSDYPALKKLKGRIEGIAEDKNGALWIGVRLILLPPSKSISGIAPMEFKK